MDVRLLVVDDDPVMLTLASKILERNNYRFSLARNGKEALKIIKESRCNILITDLSMPEMDGKELIHYINRHHPEIVSIVMSASMDVDNLLATLDENMAYSYLLKPLEPQRFLAVIERAFVQYEKMQKAAVFTSSEQALYKNMMETFAWKDELHAKHVTSIATDIIRQLNISFAHGAGIGSLLSTLSLFFSIARLDEAKGIYEVPKEIYTILQDNHQSSSKMIESFSNAQKILMEEKKIETKENITRIYDILDETIEEVQPLLKIKNQKISAGELPKFSANKKIFLHREKMQMVFNEILINAMKYSGNDDTIYIMFFQKDKFFEIKVLNPAYRNEDGSVGITEKYERYVFEPFFRLSPVMDENFMGAERFSYGLGLPIIKKIMDLHEANIFVYTVKNLSLGKQEQDVSVTLRFQILE